MGKVYTGKGNLHHPKLSENQGFLFIGVECVV